MGLDDPTTLFARPNLKTRQGPGRKWHKKNMARPSQTHPAYRWIKNQRFGASLDLIIYAPQPTPFLKHQVQATPLRSQPKVWGVGGEYVMD